MSERLPSSGLSEADPRALCQRLLAETEPFTTTPIRPDNEQELAIQGLLIRSRRLFHSATTLADAGFRLEPMILNRALTEYAITLAWIAADPDDRHRRWLIADIAQRLKLDAAVSRLDSEPLLDEEFRAELRKYQAELIAACAEGASGMPSVEVRAKDIGVENAYDRAYRSESLVGVHPNAAAVDILVEPGLDGPILHPDIAPGRESVDPYASSAIMFLIATLAFANHRVDKTLATTLEGILGDLRRGSRRA